MLLSPNGGTDSPTPCVCRGMERRAHVGQDTRTACFAYRLGKEVMVFVYRLERQLEMLKACPITAKFGGATGNYNAHHVAYPRYDWKSFGNNFVAGKLGWSVRSIRPRFPITTIWGRFSTP